MVEFDTSPSDSEVEGCLIALEASVEKEGVLNESELEEIDEVMSSIGSSRTGQRVNVESTKMEKSAKVKYVYQERISGRSISNSMDRLEAFTRFDSPKIWIGTEVVELKE